MTHSKDKHHYLREAQVTYRTHDVARLTDATIKCSSDLAAPLQQLIGADITESLLVVALTTRHKVLGYHLVSRGGINHAPMALCDVFRYPLTIGAHAILLAHNHPSGDPTPSFDDNEATGKVRAAADLLGVTLLDHLIVTDSTYYSYVDNHMLAFC